MMPDQMRELKVVNATGNVIFHVDGKGKVLIEDEDGKLYAVFQPHMLLLRDPDTPRKGSIDINALSRTLVLYDKTGSEKTVHLDGQSGNVTLRASNGENRILLDAPNANAYLGGDNEEGNLFLFPRGATSFKTEEATIHLDGESGNVTLRASNGENRILLDVPNANAYLGGDNEEGNLFLFPRDAISFKTEEATIHLDGESGDIILQNGDCAEDFQISDNEEVEPGSVVVIDAEGKLRQSAKAYDKRVAGVISGAGGNKPGIILGRDPSNGKAMPIALSGKVYCKADAAQAPIQVGDLLTTSDIPGYAMKATDPTKAFGAVIGKALRPLDSGQGVIPILVALQ
jgi:hypothetical protein